MVARIAKQSFESAAERKNTITSIQNIIRCSLTEFEKGAEDYRIFRETRDTPDWGVVRMSSIAMSHQRSEQAELFLKQQMEEYGGSARRQARNVDVSDDQICAAIQRVLNKDKTGNSAFQFFEFLKKYKFCSNRDVFARVLIEFTVKKFGWKAGLERLNELVHKDQRTKSMTMSVFFILEDAWNAKEFEQAEILLSKTKFIKPSTLRSLQLFIRFNEMPRLEIADYCKPMPLIRLLEIHQFIQIPTSTFFSIFDELIKLAGKSGKTENLEELMWKVKANREVSDNQKSILYGKIRHFYKCLNVKAPEKLYILINCTDSQ
ncbi:ERAP1_C domain-containing protein [Caenorhabditis elegans]|uniref:ERAP1_C domain-containing protein n=1 Tax=Caenorhabditis elegans TaxID=6239 RepID=Q2PJ75_CAEEL|nr:ERAP1_C domain-containing protein [Caenorhabditis elegans]CAJ55251.1 ERAP1_C domain-containing protein [Caenorhabditis elegans]|eukprot:NP_001041083.1 Uncharacterized protein CELE_C14C10.2 [Caenorhabditis elegans]